MQMDQNDLQNYAPSDVHQILLDVQLSNPNRNLLKLVFVQNITLRYDKGIGELLRGCNIQSCVANLINLCPLKYDLKPGQLIILKCRGSEV